MKKVFISQPMNGLSDLQISKERDYAMRNGIEIHYLHEEDYKEIDW